MNYVLRCAVSIMTILMLSTCKDHGESINNLIDMKGLKPVHTIPLDLSVNRPILTVSIEGKGEFKFILDTGASENVISKSLYTLLTGDTSDISIVNCSGEIVTGNCSAPEASMQLKIKNARIDSFALNNLLVSIMDFNLPFINRNGFLATLMGRIHLRYSASSPINKSTGISRILKGREYRSYRRFAPDQVTKVVAPRNAEFSLV